MRIVPLVVAALLLLPSAASAVEAAPSNDDFADAVDLADRFVEGVTVAATKESGEPNHAGDSGGHDILVGGPGADVCRADPGDARRTC